MTSISAPRSLTFALAQLNPVMGDISGNLEKARAARAEARRAGADLLVLTELFICGYTPEDLVLKPAVQRDCRKAIEALAADTADGGPGVLIGTPWVADGKLHNAAALLDGGRVAGLRFKVDLPNYSVFDEKRVFVPGPMPGPIDFRGVPLGVPICEDIWGPDVVECLAETGAELLVVPNGSPYRWTAFDERMQAAVARVVESGLPLIYLNTVGGQDELVFDGASFAINADRTLALQMPAFREAFTLVTAIKGEDGWTVTPGEVIPLPDIMEANWRACVLGLRDYVDKNRFPGVVLGLSGGIDSAVVAAMAVDAFGPERVRCLMLPYRYTSMDSLEDAAKCAAALNVQYDVVEIVDPVEGFLKALGPMFEGTKSDTTEENLQSRARGVILMAVSNKFGSMVLTTGNKSEMSVGYCTLYGDMNGGFNPIKDLYKMEVYALARWRNDHQPEGLKGPGGEVIPERIITKAPTAELRENQTDQDSLPPYPVLDAILKGLVEEERTVAELVASGLDEATVKRIEHLLYIAEYKRRQAAPGVKITTKNFGRDRRYPITNRFRDRG
ncbi:NAD+ synthase [Oryzibacter oryziterrae]|uniref:NAD+ synthase n=1 Tax=Oryzibacter oryziterrae TaxID=2766474 RepID=UPI001F02C6C2|nr:NAD+ synthase [Oryzibacter oryziterrae]